MSLLGDAAIHKLVPNHDLVWRLAQSYQARISPGSPDAHSTAGPRSEVPPSSSVGLSPGLGRHVGRNPFPAPATTSTPLPSDSLPESGTFGSHLVGNRIQVARDTELGASPTLGPMDTWGRPSHTGPVITAASAFTTPSAGPSFTFSSSSWVMGPTPEDSALKQELPRSGRSLQGNWLAYWQYEIGINQQDPHFHFHQIDRKSTRLNSSH